MWAYATSKTVNGGRTSPAAFARPSVCSAKAFTLKRGIEAKLNATTVQQSKSRFVISGFGGGVQRGRCRC